MKTINDIAEDLYLNEFSGLCDIPNSGSISNWLEANIGRLNVIINTEFEIDDELDDEASSIYYSIYMREYMRKQSANAARGISTSLGVLSVKEADSTVSFVNKNEVAKTWMAQAKNYSDDIDEMVAKYNIYKSYPRQVHGTDSDTTEDVFPPDPIVRF